jgi:hypothetical protein
MMEKYMYLMISKLDKNILMENSEIHNLSKIRYKE